MIRGAIFFPDVSQPPLQPVRACKAGGHGVAAAESPPILMADDPS
jgi:hypothetical protein